LPVVNHFKGVSIVNMFRNSNIKIENNFYIFVLTWSRPFKEKPQTTSRSYLALT